ncbi:MAG: protein kinase [Planctomycetota bacterium]|nr:protein kinase [Planctomycetota bacterium]
MKKIDQLFLRAAHKKGLLEEAEVKQIVESLGESDSAAAAVVAAGMMTEQQSHRLLSSIESSVPPEGIPGFEILSAIGRGATSTVWKARQESLGKIVALKVFSTAISSKTESDELIAEARNVALLNHPHIVHALDAGISNGNCWFAMELVEGETLQQKLARRGALSDREVAELALCLSQGLAHAHGSGLLHRDLKPGNILISEDGVPKITDLGLALAEEEAMELDTAEKRQGTPHYISPEQAQGEALDVRSDLYSLGATLYHCLTGRPPFQGKTNKEILKKHIQEEVVPVVTISGKESPLNTIVEKLLSKEPGQRYANTEQLLLALDQVANGNQQESVTALRRTRSKTHLHSATSRKRVIGGASKASLQSRNTLMTKIGAGVGVAISGLLILSAFSKANEGTPNFEDLLAQQKSEIGRMKIEKRMAEAAEDWQRHEESAQTSLNSTMAQDHEFQIRLLEKALLNFGRTKASEQMTIALDRVKGDIVQMKQADGRAVLEEARALATSGKLWAAVKLLDERPRSARRDQELNTEINKLLAVWEEEIDSRFLQDRQKIDFLRSKREYAEAITLIDQIEEYADPDTVRELKGVREEIITQRNELARAEAKRRNTEELRKYKEIWPKYRELAMARDFKGMISVSVTLDAELIVDQIKNRIETDLTAFQLLDKFIKEALQELREKGEDGKEVIFERIPLGTSTRNRKDKGVVDRIDEERIWVRLSDERAVVPLKISELTDSFLFDQVAERHGRTSQEYLLPLGILSIYRGLEDVAAENFRVLEEKGVRPDTWIALLDWVRTNISKS